MSAALRTRAEIEKLARVLHRDPAELDDLAGCAPHDVRALRQAISDTLAEADRRHFARVAAVAVKVPIPVAAKLAEHALGPVLCARVTGMVDVDLACKLARRLSPGFLAEIAVELDPRSAEMILSCLPGELVAKAAKELDDRGEHVAMSMFVGHLDAAALAQTAAVLSDEALLRVGFLLEAPERLDEVFAGLPDERVAAIVELAEREGRHDELAGIAEHLSPRQLRRAQAA